MSDPFPYASLDHQLWLSTGLKHAPEMGALRSSFVWFTTLSAARTRAYPRIIYCGPIFNRQEHVNAAILGELIYLLEYLITGLKRFPMKLGLTGSLPPMAELLMFTSTRLQPQCECQTCFHCSIRLSPLGPLVNPSFCRISDTSTMVLV